MSNLRDRVVKLAFDNPGEIRDKLLPILAAKREHIQGGNRDLQVVRQALEDWKTRHLDKWGFYEVLHPLWKGRKVQLKDVERVSNEVFGEGNGIEVPVLKMRMRYFDQLGGKRAAAGWTETDIGGKKYRFKKNKRFDPKNPVQSGFDMEYENPKYGWRDLKNLGSRDKVVKKHFKKGSRGKRAGFRSPTKSELLEVRAFVKQIGSRHGLKVSVKAGTGSMRGTIGIRSSDPGSTAPRIEIARELLKRGYESQFAGSSPSMGLLQHTIGLAEKWDHTKIDMAIVKVA